jgi:nucleoside-diphosphate-sugar epimerase
MDIFVTGGSGFIGSVFVGHAVAEGHRVRVLCRSETSGERVRALGAEPVTGDLLEAGPWQGAAASAEAIVHLAQPETYGARVSKSRAESYREHRLHMDNLLLEALRPETVRRVLYIAGTSYYGNQGIDLRHEDTTPNPKGWGPYIAPAIALLPGYIQRGLPLIEVFPGWVYGSGSWFAEYTLEPLHGGKRLTALGGRSRLISPVHVTDLARALVHLLRVGEVGNRYFVVDDRPVPSSELGRIAGEALGAQVRVRHVPVWLSRLLLGPIITESLTCDACLSNERLRATGFELEFPNVEVGIPDVVATWLQRRGASGVA